MRLSVHQRLRLVTLYNKVEFSKSTFEKLVELAKNEDIFISPRRARDIINKWHRTQSVVDLPSETRHVKKTKITNHEIKRIDRAVYRKRHLFCQTLKAKFSLETSVRSIERYVKRVGWRKVLYKLRVSILCSYFYISFRLRPKHVE